jgi:hypothetical protein
VLAPERVDQQYGGRHQPRLIRDRTVHEPNVGRLTEGATVDAVVHVSRI